MMRLYEFLSSTRQDLTEGRRDRYMQMVPVNDTDVRNFFEKYMDESINLYRRDDRIIWSLRWLKLYTVDWFIKYGLEYIKAPEETYEEFRRIQQRLLRWFHKNTSLTTDYEILEAMAMVQSDRWTQKVEHYLSLNSREVEGVLWSNETPSEIDINLGVAEREWIERMETKGGKGNIDVSDDEQASIILKFPDGRAWWKLDRPWCSKEGDAMGHCGNRPAGSSSDDHILSFRSPIQTEEGNFWRPHLTFIWDHKTGMLGEMKGRANEKPASKYHPYIVELLKQDFIKGVIGGGYDADNNFELTDLDDAVRTELVKNKPELMGYRGLDEVGADPQVVLAHLNAVLEMYGGDPVELWSPKNTRYFVVHRTTIKEFVKYNGGDHAKWILDVQDGGERLDVPTALDDHYSENFFIGIDQNIFRKIAQMVDQEDFHEFNPNGDITIPEDVWEYLSEEELGEIHDMVLNAIHFGIEMGTEQNLIQSLTNYVDELESDDEFGLTVHVENHNVVIVIQKSDVFSYADDLKVGDAEYNDLEYYFNFPKMDHDIGGLDFHFDSSEAEEYLASEVGLAT